MKLPGLLFILLCFVSYCNENQHQESVLTREDITTLKSTYSPEVFTYFYETVFTIDRQVERTSFIHKWDTNIKMIISGSPTPVESKMVLDVKKLINSRGLPIKFKVVDREEDANWKFYFGSKEELDSVFDLTPTTFGTAISYSTHGRITAVDLGIIRNDNTQDPKMKKAVILEEMVQALGISGDSFFYPNSIFFEGRNYQTEMAEIDKQVLQLLYDPRMPVNYSREKFEKDFGDVVYTLNTSEKLQAYFQEEALPIDLLKTIGSTCFVNGLFYKHPREVAVYVYGDASREDSLHIKKSIAAFNQVSPYVQLKMTPFTNDYPTAGIVFHFQKRQDQEYTAQAAIRTTSGTSTIRPKRILNEVDFYFKDTADGREKINKNITKVLYKCLGPLEMQDLDDLFTIRNGEIILAEDHNKLLEIIYQPIFADGFTLTEYEVVLHSLEQTDEL